VCFTELSSDKLFIIIGEELIVSKFDKRFSGFLSAGEARFSPLKMGLGGFFIPPRNSKSTSQTCLTGGLFDK
jgi:hypothetical protein